MAAPEAMTYISPAHEAMKPFAERPAKDEKQEHGAMVGIPADVLNTYKPPLSDDTPNFYVENKQEKRVNVTQESLTAALEEAAEVQRRANEAYIKEFGQWPAELEANEEGGACVTCSREDAPALPYMPRSPARRRPRSLPVKPSPRPS